jgi:hypothetical protein
MKEQGTTTAFEIVKTVGLALPEVEAMICFVAYDRGEGAEAHAARKSLESGACLTFPTGPQAYVVSGFSRT